MKNSNPRRKTKSKQAGQKFLFLFTFGIYQLVSFLLRTLTKVNTKKENGGLILVFQFSKSIITWATHFREPSAVGNISSMEMEVIWNYFQHLECLEIKILRLSFYSEAYGSGLKLPKFHPTINECHCTVVFCKKCYIKYIGYNAL